MRLQSKFDQANKPFTIDAFYDPDTYTLTFVVYDPKTKDAVVIDPVLDYDPKASSTSTESVKEVAAYVEEQGLKLHYIMETHAHADQLHVNLWGVGLGSWEEEVYVDEWRDGDRCDNFII